MKNFLQIARGIAVSDLLLEIQRQPWLWNQQRMRKEGEGTPHGGMDDIWLRYNPLALDLEKQRDHRALTAEHDSVWFPAARALPAAMPIVFGLMNMVRGERLGGVLITRIPPGGEIPRHVDSGWHVDYYDKYYVTLEGPGDAYFWASADDNFDESLLRGRTGYRPATADIISPEPGDVYHFDNRIPHGVVNTSDRHARMTLIVCIRSDRSGSPA